MAAVWLLMKACHGLANGRLPLTSRQVVDRKFDAASVVMDKVDQRLSLDKIVVEAIVERVW